jgi:hypothetical protein
MHAKHANNSEMNDLSGRRGKPRLAINHVAHGV